VDSAARNSWQSMPPRDRLSVNSSWEGVTAARRLFRPGVRLSSLLNLQPN
jgi:hypothetical protein